MHDHKFWQHYINTHREELKQLVRQFYPDKNQFYTVFEFVNERLIRRLVEADTEYKQTDCKEEFPDIDSYFETQAIVIIQSYFWSVFIVDQYDQMQSIVNWKCWPDERKEVLSYVRDKIIHNDYRALRIHDKDRSTPESYFSYVVHQKIKSFFDDGCNITAWIKKRHSLFKKVYQYLCCRLRTEDEVIDKLTKSNHKYNTIQHAIEQIQRKYPDCGVSDIEIPIETTLLNGYIPKEMDIETLQLIRFLNVIFSEKYENSPDDPPLMQQFKEELNQLNIKAKQRIMIRLYFFEGYTYKEIGDKLGLTTDQVSGQIKYVRDKLKEIITQFLGE
jgi:RNA polymerase sigma factor (sigma-70 family)